MKPSAISTVVNAIFTKIALIHVITFNHHDLTSLSPIGHYHTSYLKVDPCNINCIVVGKSYDYKCDCMTISKTDTKPVRRDNAILFGNCTDSLEIARVHLKLHGVNI